LAKRQIINEAIDRLFLRREAPRISDLCDEIEARCRLVGLTPPSRATVERHVATFDQRRLVRLREGPTAASEQFTIRSGMIEVLRPLQIVQIDHTLADVFVVDEETRVPAGRPYLTLAIDVFSRMVVGFHLTMDYPSVLSVGLCLTQAVFEKGEWLESRNIHLSWPCSGLPELLYLDNAAEFHSRALAFGCEEHGIKVNFRPPRTPHFGGHIERLIGTTMGALHLLPGTTRSSVADKRDYDPERRAAMTLRQLERWIALEIVGKYHNRIHSALGRPPMAVWNEHAADAVWKRPGDRVRFLLDFLPRCERHLQKTGIEFMKFQYSSPELRSFNIRKKTKVGVRYDPRDISRIWVEVAPGSHVETRWRNLGLPPMTLWERISARKRLRAQGCKESDARAIGYAVVVLSFNTGLRSQPKSM
jgi:putative transposase